MKGLTKMTPTNAYETLLLQRRLEYLRLSDPIRIWQTPDPEIPPATLAKEFDDINTREKLLKKLAAIKDSNHEAT